MTGDSAPPIFAGELFLILATEGRLVIDAARADQIIAELERTLGIVRARLQVIRDWQSPRSQHVPKRPPELTQYMVDAVFVEQLAPGRLEEAFVELPKYIEAVRRARSARPNCEQ